MSLELGSFFTDTRHQAFSHESGDPAVVLIHGFPGTPAETRAAALRLHAAGLSTYGVLLPGFGPEIDRLLATGPSDWVGEVINCVRALRGRGKNVVLFGFSFGGAVALHAAAQEGVTGVVLAAPFWRIGGTRERWIWQLTRRIFPSFRPFRNLDFSKKQIMKGMEMMLPGIDMSRPEVQQTLRELRVPAAFVDGVMRLGGTAKEKAAAISTPALIIQGSEDEVISPKFTIELAESFPSPPDYLEVRGGHHILEPDAPSFETVLTETLAFIRRLPDQKRE